MMHGPVNIKYKNSSLSSSNTCYCAVFEVLFNSLEYILSEM